MKLNKRTLNRLIKEEISKLFSEVNLQESYRVDRAKIQKDLDEWVAKYNKAGQELADAKEIGDWKGLKRARMDLKLADQRVKWWKNKLIAYDSDLSTADDKLSPIGKKVEKWAGPGSVEAAPKYRQGAYKKKMRRGGGCGTRFLRKYKAKYLGMMDGEYGGHCRRHFRKMYKAAKAAGWRGKRDYVFGRGHVKAFNLALGQGTPESHVPGATPDKPTLPQKAALKHGSDAPGEAAMSQTHRRYAAKYQAATGAEKEKIFRNAVRHFEQRSGQSLPQNKQGILRSVLNNPA